MGYKRCKNHFFRINANLLTFLAITLYPWRLRSANLLCLSIFGESNQN